MNRRTVLRLTTTALLCTGVVFSASHAPAQQKSLKDQLMGAWTLVSQDTTAPDGSKRQPYGANPKGILILDASGRYAFETAQVDRPKLSPSDARLSATAEELSAAARGFEANFGAWSVNEADKILIRRIEGALIPNNEGNETKNSVSLTGDELKLVNIPARGGRTERVYKRAK